MATENKYPQSHTDSSGWTNATQCYNKNDADYGYDNIDNDYTPAIEFYNWESAGGTYSDLTLYTKWSTDVTTGNDKWNVQYSINGGGAWNEFPASGNYAGSSGAHRATTAETISVALASDQNLAQLRVRVNFDLIASADPVNIQIWEVWTVGTLEESSTSSMSSLSSWSSISSYSSESSWSSDSSLSSLSCESSWSSESVCSESSLSSPSSTSSWSSISSPSSISSLSSLSCESSWSSESVCSESSLSSQSCTSSLSSLSSQSCLSSYSSESICSESSESSFSSLSCLSSYSSQSVGTVCWGQISDVAETYSRTFSDHWTGDGTISGSGDAETLTLLSIGDEAISETWNIGAGELGITIDKYGTGSGPAPTIYYKTGTTKANCEADTWHEYTGTFLNMGWIKVRLLK